MSKKKSANNSIIELESEQPKLNTPHRVKPSELRKFEPLTDNQKKFFDAYARGDYFVMLTGSAGTGKSFIACYKAIEEVYDKTSSFRRVVIVRSAVPSRDIGFLPGSLDEKSQIYELPYMEIFKTLFNRRDAYDQLKESTRVEFLTTTSLRGVTIDDAIIIVDEFQNCNWGEINTIMSRVGNRSKIILCGDFKQNDLTKSSKDTSAFHDFVKVARIMPSFTEIYFTPDDIVRSSLVKDWIVACEKLGL